MPDSKVCNRQTNGYEVKMMFDSSTGGMVGVRGYFLNGWSLLVSEREPSDRCMHNAQKRTIVSWKMFLDSLHLKPQVISVRFMLTS